MTLSFAEFKVLFVGAARYGYVRSKHPDPDRFDHDVDAQMAAELDAYPPPSGMPILQ